MLGRVLVAIRHGSVAACMGRARTTPSAEHAAVAVLQTGAVQTLPDGGILLHVRVKPGAKQSQVVGVDGAAISMQVGPPVHKDV